MMAERLAETFLVPEDVDAIVYGAGELPRERSLTGEELAVLVRHAARIRFEIACLENVRAGLVAMDLAADGSLLWRLTRSGEHQAALERDGILSTLTPT